jgi:hypothetical protein
VAADPAVRAIPRQMLQQEEQYLSMIWNRPIFKFLEILSQFVFCPQEFVLDEKLLDGRIEHGLSIKNTTDTAIKSCKFRR